MVCAALAREQGFAVLALTVDYNQRHRVEIEAAKTIASALADRHIILPLDLRAFGGSALTSDASVPKDGVQPGIPITYVPARNLSLSEHRDGLGRSRGCERPVHRSECARLLGLSRLPARVHRRLRAACAAGNQGGNRGGANHDPRAAPAHDQGGHRARGKPARPRCGAESQLLRPGCPTAAIAGCATLAGLRAKGFEEAGLADPTRYAVAG